MKRRTNDFFFFFFFLNAIFGGRRISYIEIGSLCYWGKKIPWSWPLTVGPFSSSACPSQNSHIWDLLVFSIYKPSTGNWCSHCNTAFSLLLELHRLQPKSAESCYCHSALRLALIISTSGEKEEAMWNVGTPKSSCQEDFPLPLPHQQGFSSWRTISKLLPLHDPYSLKDPTHTNIYEESVRHLAGQAILLHREQSCRGPPLTACVLPVH